MVTGEYQKNFEEYVNGTTYVIPLDRDDECTIVPPVIPMIDWTDEYFSSTQNILDTYVVVY